MNGPPTRLRAGPARRAVLRRRRRRAAAARIEEARGLRVRGLGLRGDHPAPLRLRGRLRRAGPGAARRIRSSAATGACSPCAPTSRACWPRSPPAGSPTGRAPHPPLLLGRGAALRAAARPGGRASCSRWASSTWAADRRAADAEILAIAAECLERARRRAAGCSRSATWACSTAWSRALGLARRRAGRCCASAWKPRTRTGVRDVLAGARRRRPGRGRARAPERAGRRRAPSLDGGRARARVLAREPRRAVARAARGRGRAGRGRPRRPRGHRPRRGARPRLLHGPRLPRLRARPGLRGGRRAAATTRCWRASAGPMPAVGFMLGLDRVALLLERQEAAPRRPTPPPRSASTGPALGDALAQARARRAAGARVRFGDGEAER